MRFESQEDITAIIDRHIELFGYYAVWLSPTDFETALSEYNRRGVVAGFGKDWFTTSHGFSVHLDEDEEDYN